MNRTLFRKGTLVDGTGAPPVLGDLPLEDDRIAAVGAFDPSGRSISKRRCLWPFSAVMVPKALLAGAMFGFAKVTWLKALYQESSRRFATTVGFVRRATERDLCWKNE